MILKTKLLGHVYEFKSVKDALAKANEEKSGDRLAGIAAENAEERVAAKVVVANLTLADLRANPAVPYEEDEVTRIIQDDVNEKIYDEIKHWTVAELREWLLDEKNGGDAIRRVSRGLTAEMIAAVAKLMSNLDLIYAANITDQLLKPRGDLPGSERKDADLISALVSGDRGGQVSLLQKLKALGAGPDRIADLARHSNRQEDGNDQDDN